MSPPWNGGWPASMTIADTFARLRRERRPGLVTYTTAGDPEAAGPRRRGRPRGRRAVFGSAGRRPRDPARNRTCAGGRWQPAGLAVARGTGAPGRLRAD